MALLIGSYACTPYTFGCVSARRTMRCVSYSRKPLNSSRPPYSDTDARPAPSTVVGARNMEAIDDANTTPSPMASGPPMYRNWSLGAHTATVDRPPTMPAVYQAARISTGPPTKQTGARMAPMMAQWPIQASCLTPTLPSYGMERTSMPLPIIRAMDAIMGTKPPAEAARSRAVDRKAAAAEAAVMRTEPPK